MGCSSCSGGVGRVNAYVPGTERSYIKTTGRVIGDRALGHFAQFVPATERSYITTTGPVEGVPNTTGGMHTTNYSRSGMGTIFGADQTNWISGVENEYIVAAGALVLLLVAMK